MKHRLISEKGQFYKANLHCHTTVSDGKLTPEQTKKAYLEHGYSIVAFTDHDVFIPHPELKGSNFLPLNGFEVEIVEENLPWHNAKNCHICFIALDPDTERHPLWHRKKYLFGGAGSHRDEVKFDPEQPDYERKYSAECISDMMRRGRENGFFVTYNHPKWSTETYEQYSKYNDMHAMEIYNHGCFVEGYDDYNPSVYDDLLRQGKRIYCTATDDNHNLYEEGNPRCDSFGGFVMIKAEALDYKCITDALLRGDFYASRGPEIHDLWFDTEDKTLHIACSKAIKILCSSGIRKQRLVNAYDFQKDFITEAIFPVYEDDIYLRLTVFDEQGHTADTNAYFVDELLRKTEA